MHARLHPAPLYLSWVFAGGTALATTVAACGDDIGTDATGGASATASTESMTSAGTGVATATATTTGTASGTGTATTGASMTTTSAGETTTPTSMSTGDTASSSSGDSDSEGIDTADQCEPGATESCYSGPEETLGVGVCVAGTRTCNDEGTAFGPCAGEVTPTAELCDTPTDENCSGDVLECGAALWKKRFGGVGSDEGRGLAVGPDDGVVISGLFDAGSSISFGGATFDNKGSFDGFIASFDSDGTHRWSRAFGSPVSDAARSVAIDSTGAVILAGDVMGTVDLGGGPLNSAGDQDIIVAKYDSEGEHLWSTLYKSPQKQVGLDCAVTSDDGVLLGGVFRGNVDFGGDALASAGADDIYLAKLDEGGEHLWSKRFGDAAGDYAAATVVGPSDMIVQAGHFTGGLNYGGADLVSAGGLDVFVAKLNADGGHLWSKRFGDDDNQRAETAAIAADGRVLVGGSFGGSIDFGGDVLTSEGGQDAFVAVLDGDGSHLWSRRLHGAGAESVTAIATDSDGNVLVGGLFGGSLEIGGATLTTEGLYASFLAKYDPAGELLFSTSYDSEVSSWIVGIAADSLGDVFFAGHFTETIDIDGDELISAGYDDVILAKIAP